MGEINTRRKRLNVTDVTVIDTTRPETVTLTHPPYEPSAEDDVLEIPLEFSSFGSTGRSPPPSPSVLPAPRQPTKRRHQTDEPDRIVKRFHHERNFVINHFLASIPTDLSLCEPVYIGLNTPRA